LAHPPPPKKPIYGVFLVTASLPGTESEEAQAHPVIDEAVKNGVQHVVFTSVDRGGASVSDKNSTDVPHFASKHRIEAYLKDKTQGTKTNWTILRPVAFMDNFGPGFMGKLFLAIWSSGLGNEKTLQLISVHDIGVFAARAFQNPAEYSGRAISLAGDELTLKQAKRLFNDTVGHEMPSTFGFLGTAALLSVKDTSMMFMWFSEVGFGADIEELRKEEPKLQSFSRWLKENSGFTK
jgi:uncharacterized protein YbjT (DUF2867 family)